jgi:spore germination protein
VPPTPTPTPLPPAVTVHVVRPGETLLGLAAAYGAPVEAIRSANDLPDPNLIVVDQRLIVPLGQDGAPPLETGVYRTQADESLATLAYRYRTTAAIVAGANGLLRADQPLPGGLRLRLPAVEALRLERAVHTVQPGETPLSVALAHHTSVWQIALANELRFPYLPPAGADLVIP